MPLDLFSRSKKNTHILDTLPINVLTCDPETLMIDYANKLSVKTLNEFSHIFPQGVRGDNIIGQSISIFHEKQEFQPNLPYSTILRLGTELLDLHIEAIYSGSTVIKLVLSWSICTERERLRIMMDNLPINVMMTSPEDLTINYANKKSLNTLKKIEHFLPIKAEEAVGTCIDKFDKTPEHQRQILRDPNNLPYSSKIKMGTEILQLDVFAIKDNTGYYIGPMVTWSVITAQEDFAQNVMEIARIVSSKSEELQSTANKLSDAANNSSAQSTTASTASEEASVNVQTVASAAEELSASIEKISRKIVDSDFLAQQAMEHARETNKTVESLRNAAKKINSVVAIINDIAEQTNLLALNATIQAARAGDAGKGFSIVALEVKALANQTADATQQIQQQIRSIQNITSTAVLAVCDISKSIKHICEASAEIADAMEKQSAATAEIARNVNEAATGTFEVNRSVGQVQKSAAVTRHSAEQLLNLSKLLSENSDQMFRQVSNFMNDGDTNKKKEKEHA